MEYKIKLVVSPQASVNTKTKNNVSNWLNGDISTKRMKTSRDEQAIFVYLSGKSTARN